VIERSNVELDNLAYRSLLMTLQEPLRMISSFMDLLKRRNEVNLMKKRAHKYIYVCPPDGAKRMKQIILDLLDYSRAKVAQWKERAKVRYEHEVISEFKQVTGETSYQKIGFSLFSANLPTLHTATKHHHSKVLSFPPRQCNSKLL